MPSVDEIRQSIEARIAELRTEMMSLEGARAALHDKRATRARNPTAVRVSPRTDPKRHRSAGTPAENGRARTEPGNADTATARAAATNEASTKLAATSRKPRTRTGRRSAKPRQPVEVSLAGKLEAMLRGTQDGLSTTAIVNRANAGASQVRGLLRDLESAGQVRRAGARRTSRWRWITDEERIAERAAELERLTTAKR